MTQPKLRDIAYSAGVSIATVSLVLSGKGKISKEVISRVIKEAERLGYQKLARTKESREKKIKYIAILHFEPYEYLWNFIRPLFLELEGILLNNNYIPIIFNVSIDKRIEDILQHILYSNAGAVFSIHYGNDRLFRRLENMNIPVVVINNSDFQDRFSSVCVDDFQGAYEGTMHLIKLGHKKILYIDYFRKYISSVVMDRFVGFKKAVNEAGIAFSDAQRITVDINNINNFYPRLKGILMSKEKPTAIFFHDDYIAALIIVMLKKFNINIPGDISVIAPGDVLDYKQPFLPKITTLSIDISLMSQLSGNLMLSRLKSKNKTVQVLKVKQQLVKRGSCKKI